MRNGLVGLAGLVVVLGACSGVPAEDRSSDLELAAGAGSPPSSVVLTPTTDPSVAQTVTWRTTRAWADQRVVARSVEGGPQLTATARRKPATTVRDSGSAMPAWTATLTGLEPGTRYRYRVSYAEGTSGNLYFTTPERGMQPWSFLALGDTQVDNAGVPAAIVRTAIERVPRVNLVLHAGDVVNHPWEKQEWTDLMKALAPVRTSRNVAVSIGNHEQCILLRDCRSGDAEGFRTAFTAPSNGVSGQRPTWYSFDQQGVRFVVLDSFGSDLAAQARFLDERLTDDPNRWSVVLMHAGPFASRSDRTNQAVFDTVLPVIEEHDVDLVLNGHDHVYSSGYRGDRDSTVFATSDSGPKYYDPSAVDWERRGATRTRWAEDISTYQLVDVTKDTLRYRAFVASKGSSPRPSIATGKTLDDITISKDAAGSKTVTRR